MEKINFNRGKDSLHDTAYLRARYFAVPKKIVQSLSTPHLKHDDTYLTRRARGQLSGVESILTSLLRYNSSRKNNFKFKENIYNRKGTSDLASQLGVQPYTVLPSPSSGYSSLKTPTLNYGSNLGKPFYSSSPVNYQKKNIEYLV